MALSKMDLREMMRLTRVYADAHDLARVVNGLAGSGRDDTWSNLSAIRILPLLNDGVEDLADTGFMRCEYIVPMSDGVREYVMPSTAHEVHSAWLLHPSSGRTYDMTQTDVHELDMNIPGWRNGRGMRPYSYYFVGTYVLGVYPTPTSNDYSVGILATSSPVPMDSYTQYPTQVVNADGNVLNDTDGLPVTMLPAQFHSLPCRYAAKHISAILGNASLYEINSQEYESGKERLAALVNSRHVSDIRQITPQHYPSISRPRITSGYRRTR